MIYTLNDCIPCQRAKQFLALNYSKVRAHFLELSGNEPWQLQLQNDLQYLTGAITFPYIFVCGQYIGGKTFLLLYITLINTNLKLSFMIFIPKIKLFF